jgi:hypothetical protein
MCILITKAKNTKVVHITLENTEQNGNKEATSTALSVSTADKNEKQDCGQMACGQFITMKQIFGVKK